MQRPCVVFAANRGYALTSSRRDLIRHFVRAQWKVVLATADDTESCSLCEQNVVLEPITFSRGGFSPYTDICAYYRLRQIYKKWQPALVQHFHAKPVILGSIAARKTAGDSVRISNVITGLGHAFIKGGFSAKLSGKGYGLALPRADITIFQNRDDKSLFLDRGWVNPNRARLITSSGVNLRHFEVADRSERDATRPTIVMLGRLLKQKGIVEFIKVAQRIRQRWPGAKFKLAGEEDPVHPDAVKADWVRSHPDIEYVGRIADVRPLLAEADILLFPSYREGTPRVVLESAAAGLPTVAFDVPGVREVVQHGETGFLVPYRELDTMVDYVSMLLENPQLRLKMGFSARQMVEKKFDIQAIQAQYLDVYRNLDLQI